MEKRLWRFAFLTIISLGLPYTAVSQMAVVPSGYKLATTGLDAGPTLCNVQEPYANVTLPAGIAPGECVPDSARCSWLCSLEASCTSFNVLDAERVCQLFNVYTNSCVVGVTDCQLYQVGS